MSMFIDFPESNIKVEGMEKVNIPKMVKIKQKYDDFKINDLKKCVSDEMDNKLNSKDSYKGKRICITAGSRGIPEIDIMMREIVDKLKSWGAEPFIIPAMGSHGGGTAEGQLEMIAGYNITEETMGVPIISSMEVVQIGELEDKTPVYCDKHAFESDGIVVLNKIKPHTEFRGEHESGLIKMMAIGLAKHKGASMFHMKGFSRFPEGLSQLFDVFMEKAPIAFGVAIVQNAYDEISEFEVIEKENLKERDKELLKIAKDRIAKFKFEHVDVLIIDQIGKNISGNGFDPNVVGRNFGNNFGDILSVQKIFVRGLSEGTHHNGIGIGLADVTTRRCVRDIDWSISWVNTITATAFNGARIPIYMNNDKDALKLAIRGCVNIDFNNVKVARIKDTLHTYEIEVSENFAKELAARDDVEIISEPYELKFDNDNFII